MGTSGKRFALLVNVRRTLIALIAVAIIPILLAQIFIYFTWFGARVRVAQNANLDVARLTAVAVNTYVNNILRQEALLGEVITRYLPDDPQRATELLTSTVSTLPSVESLHWISADGIVTATSDPPALGLNIHDRPYFQRLLAGEDSVLGDLVVGRIHKTPTVMVARAVRDDQGKLIGAVVALVNPVAMGELVLPVRRVGEGTVTLFDSQGMLVYRWPEVDIEDRSWRDNDPLLERALQQREETTGFFQSPLGSRLMVARVPVSETGWVAGAGIPRSAMHAPLLRTLEFNIVALILAMGISILAALLISRHIVAAVRRLREHAAAVGSGDLDHRVDTGGLSEFDALAYHFNEMAARLKEQQAAERAARGQLEQAIKELESFAYSVSHDLRTPLRSIDGFSLALLEDYGDVVDEQGRDYLNRVRAASQMMGHLIDDILKLSRTTRAEMVVGDVDLSTLAHDVVAALRRIEPEREVEVVIQDGLTARGDGRLLRVVLENLLGNAWKFTNRTAAPRIEFGVERRDGRHVFFVRDNGAGFDMAYANKLFGPFQRLHAAGEFSGTGIGLATSQRIVTRHGGKIWADAAVGRGATFYFTLGETL